MRKKIATAAVAVAAIGAVGGGFAATPGGASEPVKGTAAPGLDDGQDLLSQAKIGEQQAIASAQKSASGDVGEVDLEHRDGSLVFNVDVGSHDVKVDAASGDVVAVDADD